MWKFILYSVFLMGIGCYAGYALDLGFQLDMLKTNPTLIVGGIAAALALCGVLINQVGQYKLQQLKIRAEKEKSISDKRSSLDKEYLVTLNLLKSSLRNKLLYDLEVVKSKCLHFYGFLDVQDVDIKEEIYRVLDARNTRLKRDYEKSISRYEDVLEKYYDYVSILKYHLILRNLQDTLMLFQNFEDEMIGKIKMVEVSIDRIIEQYNQDRAKNLETLKDFPPSPYNEMVVKADEIIEFFDREFSTLYNKLIRDAKCDKF